jgi:type I restriction enzyme S subunit
MKQINSIPKGYKVSSLGIIPEGWDVKKLGDLIELSSGKTKPKDTSHMPFDNCIYPVFGGNGILGYSREFSHILPQIIIGRVGEYCGNILLVNEKCWVTDNALYTKIISDSCNISYLTYKLQFEDLSKLRSKGGQPLISQQPIYLYKIILPPLPEQQKIAEILSVWDNAIDLQSRLIASLQIRKRALMQQLLTGKKRLKEFSGEWKTVKLGDIGEISSAGVDKKIIEGEQPIRLVNFLDVYRRDFIYSNELNHWVTASKYKIEKCSVKKGDIFFTPSSEVSNDIGISTVVMEDIPDAVYSYHVVRLRLNENWDLKYRAYAFKTDNFFKQAETLCDGSGQRYVISQPNFRKMTVKVPSLAEQTAIASILSSTDNEISLAQKKLAAMKTQKKGLMQQLLIGKRRVKV